MAQKDSVSPLSIRSSRPWRIFGRTGLKIHGRRTIVRAQIYALLGLLLFSFAAPAQTSLQGFTWSTNSRFDLKIVQNGTPITLKGELRDGGKVIVTGKEAVSAELKSYNTELFMVVAITMENDETGSIFLLERPMDTWLVMNPKPIRSRKLDLMTDFEGVVTAFKKVTNFSIAQSMRKMVEYFELNPTKRLQDVYDGLEKGDESLRTLPKPKISPRSGNQGVVQPGMPSEARPPRDGEPLDITPRGGRPATPPPAVEEDEREDVRRPSRPRRPAPTVEGDEPDWLRQERERQRRAVRERQRRAPEAPPQYYIDPYTGRPVYRQPMQPRPRQPQYVPRQPEFHESPPVYRRRGFFESLFGSGQ